MSNLSDWVAGAESEPPKEAGPRLRDIWPFIRPYRSSLIWASIISLIGAVATLLQPVVVSDIVDTVGGGISPGLVVFLGGLLIASGLFGALQQLILERSSERLIFSIREKLVEHYLRLPMRVLDRRSRGDLISRITSDTGAMREVVSQGVVELFASFVTIAGALIAMAFIDLALLSVVVIIVIVLIVILLFIASKTRPAAEEMQKHLGLFASRMERALGGIRTIRSTVSTNREVAHSTAEAEAALQAGLRIASLKAFVSSFATVAVQVVLLGIIGLGALRVSTGALTLGDLSAFIMYVTLIIIPIASLAGTATALSEALGSFSRIREIQCIPIEYAGDREDCVLTQDSHHIEAIRFAGVRFRYENDSVTSERAPWVLDDVSFVVPRNRVTAIVGPSGSGKSTIMALIERFYDADDGTVKFNGVEVHKLLRDDIRTQIAYVEQDAPALSGTIRDNLKLGSHNATDDQCIDALRGSNLLPNGITEVAFLDTPIGDNGILLSGGERQRLSIARALLSEASTLLLDEATSNLDANNEHLLQRAISKLKGQKTVLVIAHRLSTIVNADNIIVLRDGKVVAQGSHAVLLRESPLYSELAQRQGLGVAS